MAWFNEPSSLHGTRLEVISPTYRPGVEAWLTARRNCLGSDAASVFDEAVIGR
jgi:hypothetical protein